LTGRFDLSRATVHEFFHEYTKSSLMVGRRLKKGGRMNDSFIRFTLVL
jgi:hypothetical protein